MRVSEAAFYGHSGGRAGFAGEWSQKPHILPYTPFFDGRSAKWESKRLFFRGVYLQAVVSKISSLDSFSLGSFLTKASMILGM